MATPDRTTAEPSPASTGRGAWEPGWRHPEGTRSIDLRYLDRDPRTTDRPYFGPVLELAAGNRRRDESLRLLDVGCANGAFARYVIERCPGWDVSGIDVLPELVDAATAAVPEGRFSVADICTPRSLPSEEFDVVTALTIPSHFDSLDQWLPQVLRLVAPGGVAVLYGPLNPSPVDLICRLRYAGGSEEWLPGWNVLSQQTYDAFLGGRVRSWAYHYPKVATLGYPATAPADGLSSRIVPAPDGQRLGNSSGLTYHMACVEIHR
ncbi:class I SAM-dependent methyltransferase [Streptomyces sp. MA5143a]|uniref:class I SAM-dependent methyltransferase n=1 Tax=Streptomyces sp. MA5143a TaxID=2083010 RepID=UPI000D1B4504|nr:class I SAM-dependent methyltransferase [Streptomyces sp. MA5143a]SPF07039.1 bifunctional 3-demethylubiquinone-9 3-methyltransferase/ 2-octaprenyl-6-hydroxy phenol methylase [Streptomyces sp. MA5143a]